MHTVGDVIEQDGVQVRVTEVDDDGNVLTTEPIAAAPPAEPAPRDYAAEAERLRVENARLAGEIQGLRAARPPEPPTPAASADPYEAEYKAIEDAFAQGTISDGQRVVRLGALGARAARAAEKDQEATEAAKTRATTARQRSGQKIATYIAKYPGLQNVNGAEMARVQPHLRAVCEELDLAPEDERAQALALERTFGPIDRSLPMDHREFERRRHPVGGGGGGNAGDEPNPLPTPKSKGERIFEKLSKENQDFFLQARGSKEAAIKTLEHADENLMRRQGRFAA